MVLEEERDELELSIEDELLEEAGIEQEASRENKVKMLMNKNFFFIVENFSKVRGDKKGKHANSDRR